MSQGGCLKINSNNNNKNSPVQQQVIKRMQKKSLASPRGAMSGCWAGDCLMKSLSFLSASTAVKEVRWLSLFWQPLYTLADSIHFSSSFPPPPPPPPPHLLTQKSFHIIHHELKQSKQLLPSQRENPSSCLVYVCSYFSSQHFSDMHGTSKVTGTVCHTFSQATSWSQEHFSNLWPEHQHLLILPSENHWSTFTLP